MAFPDAICVVLSAQLHSLQIYHNRVLETGGYVARIRRLYTLYSRYRYGIDTVLIGYRYGIFTLYIYSIYARCRLYISMICQYWIAHACAMGNVAGEYMTLCATPCGVCPCSPFTGSAQPMRRSYLVYRRFILHCK